jgi:hypothetical protein
MGVRFLRFLLLVVVLCCLSQTEALFGFGNKKKEAEAKAKAEESVQAGMDALRKTAQDPELLREAMSAMQDPEVCVCVCVCVCECVCVCMAKGGDERHAGPGGG